MDLQQLDVLCAQAVLHPQVSDRQMADATQASALAYADGRGRVAVDPEVQLLAEVASEGLAPQAIRSPLDYAR